MHFSFNQRFVCGVRMCLYESEIGRERRTHTHTHLYADANGDTQQKRHLSAKQKGNSIHLIANMVWANEFRIPMAIWITECPDARTEMKCIDIHFGSWLKCIPIDVLFPRLIFTSSVPFFGSFWLKHVHFSIIFYSFLFSPSLRCGTQFFSFSYLFFFVVVATLLRMVLDCQ